MNGARKLAVAAMIAAASLTGFSAPAAAASGDFGPVSITGVPPASQKMQKIQQLGVITANLPAGKIAYVYSSLTASQSADVNLVDNEIRCSGAGEKNVVLGENLDPASSAQPGRATITIVNRFLLKATSSGTLTCRLSVRTSSLSNNTSSFTVSGTLRFASLDVAPDAAGAPLQVSLPVGNIVVDKTVNTLLVDRTMGSGHSKVAVIADVQYMSCYPTACPSSGSISTARFTLIAKQMNGNTVCASAPPATTEVAVSRQTHHKTVPLYTTITLAPGCDRLYAYVQAVYVSDYVGAIQGEADGLTDVTGSPGPGVPVHNSTMTHLFAVPS
ncbi:hypothetical protein [Fodinicola acaciae]|uniref:hypothetical protein n=1 Tax=Fodinicola acaciae TaxID=2681555 RepID=UPI0013D173A0|nr:hypothetical protein [Fodinicola acaciae]